METEFKGTPGPWRSHSRNVFQIVGAEVPSKNGFDSFNPGICNLDGNGTYVSMSRNEKLANAKLIAAAPELLRVLIKMTDSLNMEGGNDELVAECKQAINIALNG